MSVGTKLNELIERGKEALVRAERAFREREERLALQQRGSHAADGDREERSSISHR